MGSSGQDAGAHFALGQNDLAAGVPPSAAQGQMVWVIDAAGRFLGAEAWCAYTGHAPAGLKGENWLEAIHPDDRERVRAAWDLAFAGGHVYQAEYRLRRHDGLYRRFSCRGMPVYEPDGTLREWVGWLNDVEEERQAREGLARSEQALAEAQAIAHLGSWIWNLETDSAIWSAEMFRILGYEPAETVFAPTSHLQTIHPDDLHRVEAALAAALIDDAPYEIDYRVLLPDGLERCVHVRGVVTRDASGRAVRMAGTLQDVSERKRLEHELRAQKAHVEDEVRARTRALAESERRFKSAFEHAPIGMALVGLDGRFLQVNPALCDTLGYHADELCALTFDDVTHPDDLSLDWSMYQRLQEGQLRTYQIEKRYLHRSGREVWVLLSVSLVRDEAGRAEYAISKIRDITRQKELEAERTRHLAELERQQAFTQRIIDHAPASMAFVDRDYVYQWVNATWQRLTGRPAETVVGRRMAELFSPQVAAQVMAIVGGVIASGLPHNVTAMPLRVEPVGQAPRIGYFDGTYQPVTGPDGQLAGVLIMTVEVTERVERERLLSERTAEVEQMARMKDDFLSVISHELRTPLNFIMGFASLMDDHVGGPLTPTQHGYLDRILNGANRMLVLVNNLLDMSRMAAGAFEVQPALTPYRHVVDEAVSLMSALALAKGVSLAAEVALDHDVPIDGDRIVQVLTNLIDNAVKFTPEGGAIVVKAAVEDGRLRTEVTDSGVGIASEDRTKLFQPFSQVDMSRTRRVGGTGLGLSICKTIVEAHGGAIGVESAPGAGSTFWFAVPLEARA